MTREIRITVDDDEVFERMKHRKADLDLTWEEVLKRGLRMDEHGRRVETLNPPEEPGHSEGPGGPEGFGPGPEAGRHPHDPSRAGRETRHGSGEPHPGGGVESPIGDFAEQLRRQVQTQVRDSLESSMQSVHRDLDSEMRDLQDAEDAVLQFPVLPDERRYEVPLRVRLETSRDGLDVDVVAVRQGKSVTDTNRFDREARRRVNEHLATGGTATLAFGANGDRETYTVAPVCSWSRRDDGSPSVSAVDVDEVFFDDA